MDVQTYIGFIFDSVSGGESLLIIIVILMIFGPKKIPEIGRLLGRITSEFRRASMEFRNNIEQLEHEIKEPPKQSKDTEKPGIVKDDKADKSQENNHERAG